MSCVGSMGNDKGKCVERICRIYSQENEGEPACDCHQYPNIIGKLSGHKEGSRAFARYRDIDDDMLTDLVSKPN